MMAPPTKSWTLKQSKKVTQTILCCFLDVGCFRMDDRYTVRCAKICSGVNLNGDFDSLMIDDDSSASKLLYDLRT